MRARTEPRGLALEIRDVTKTYGALRPLRIASMTVAAGERISVGGVDMAAGEIFVNLVTGATLPDAGVIRVFGRSTADITDGEGWLEWLEHFGLVSPRATLLEGSTLLENLALPFTLDLDAVPAPVVDRVRALADRCGIASDDLARRAGDAPADLRVRARLARALALEPGLLLVEHPTADVEQAAHASLARDLATACSAPALAVVILTNDEAFARRTAGKHVRLHAATGAMRPLGTRWLGWS